jgi:acetyl-CoA carboxylase, biotin carboxylase subunit
VKLHRLLIANRGEIAVRIIRTCQEIGLECIVAASDADLHSVPARLADGVVRLGPGPAAQSYLDVGRVVAAACEVKADSLHPGYGFLSENVRLARACSDAGIVFVGPTDEQLEAVGDKLRARRHAVAAGLPVVPGGAVDGLDEACRLAEEIGYPVLIKAVGGGGGRGLKRVYEPSGMRALAELASAEAEAAFSDPRIYVERFVEHGRHIEVQLLGDGQGNLIHLGTRDCSIQRRYQKLVEEAPAPNLPAGLRQRIHRAAVEYGRRLRYRGAGTVEFLVDDDRGEFYFLEMNARIQVEHPVTEAITGLDLIAEQISIAETGTLRIRQCDVVLNGHAVECRINAEDPWHDFRPSPGTVSRAQFAAGSGVRVDTHITAGAAVPPFYDSLLAKVITIGATRAQALETMNAALARTGIEGVHTNIALLATLMNDAGFRAGGVNTGYFPRFLEALRLNAEPARAAGALR